MNIVKHIENKFGDENDVIELTRDEWYAIREVITVLKKNNERLVWSLEEHD